MLLQLLAWGCLASVALGGGGPNPPDRPDVKKMKALNSDFYLDESASPPALYHDSPEATTKLNHVVENLYQFPTNEFVMPTKEQLDALLRQNPAPQPTPQGPVPQQPSGPLPPPLVFSTMQMRNPRNTEFPGSRSLLVLALAHLLIRQAARIMPFRGRCIRSHHMHLPVTVVVQPRLPIAIYKFIRPVTDVLVR